MDMEKEDILYTSNIEDELEEDIVHREKNKTVGSAPINRLKGSAGDSKLDLELSLPHGSQTVSFTVLRDRVVSKKSGQYDTTLSKLLDTFGYSYSELDMFLQENIPISYNSEEKRWELDIETTDDGSVEPTSIIESPESPKQISQELFEDILFLENNIVAGFAEIERVQSADSSKGVVEIIFSLPYGDESFSRKFYREEIVESSKYPSLDILFNAVGANKINLDTLSESQVNVNFEDGEWEFENIEYKTDDEEEESKESSREMQMILTSLVLYAIGGLLVVYSASSIIDVISVLSSSTTDSISISLNYLFIHAFVPMMFAHVFTRAAISLRRRRAGFY